MHILKTLVYKILSQKQACMLAPIWVCRTVDNL